MKEQVQASLSSPGLAGLVLGLAQGDMLFAVYVSNIEATVTNLCTTEYFLLSATRGTACIHMCIYLLYMYIYLFYICICIICICIYIYIYFCIWLQCLFL